MAKEARKDALLIARAWKLLGAGEVPDGDAARELLAQAREVDREFLRRIAGFPVRIEIRYEAIEPPRLRRIELGLDTSWRILDAWRRGVRLRAAFAAPELERRLSQMLQLYAEETQALSHSVRLPVLLAPVRERLAQHLREEMTRVARILARNVATGNTRRRRVQSSAQ